MARREEAKEMWPAWVKVERAKWGRSEAVSCNKRQFGMPVAGWEDPFPHNQTLQPHHFPVPFWSLFLPFHTMPYLSRVDLGVWPWNASISVAYQTDHMTYGASCAKNSQPLFCIRLAIWILIQVSLPPQPPPPYPKLSHLVIFTQMENTKEWTPMNWYYDYASFASWLQEGGMGGVGQNHMVWWIAFPRVAVNRHNCFVMGLKVKYTKWESLVVNSDFLRV